MNNKYKTDRDKQFTMIFLRWFHLKINNIFPTVDRK